VHHERIRVEPALAHQELFQQTAVEGETQGFGRGGHAVEMVV
jgi:hypothetical protein